MALEALKDDLSENIAILTDHENLIHAMRSQAPRSYFYNELQSYIKKNHAEKEISVVFVPGKKNPADGISRRRIISNEDREKCEILWQEMLGAGAGQNATLIPNRVRVRA
eukprot:Tbor_TRINITY_DN5889_c1_g6::TRINITY_DN5889_c1_g6_i4::g.7309::m.7309